MGLANAEEGGGDAPFFTFRDAEKAHIQGDLPKAEALYLHLLNERPDDQYVLGNLGLVYCQQGKYGLAAMVLGYALKADESIATTWSNLGIAFQRLNRRDGARDCFLRALEIDPTYAAAMSNMASLHTDQNEVPEALRWAAKALEHKPDLPDALWQRALALMQAGKWSESWDVYHHGISTRHRNGRSYHDGGTPDWDGSEGKSVVVFGEQGVGDEVMFASIMPDLIAKLGRDRVIFECHPRLIGLFERSFGVLCYPTRKEKQIDWHQHHKIDAQVAIGSLGMHFRRSDAAFPRHRGYIKPGFVPEMADRLKSLGNRPKIAISWYGGARKTRRDLRSIPLADLMPVLSQDIDIISVQHGWEAPAQIEEFTRHHGIPVHHWQDAIDDLDRQSSLIAACDLTISVCGSAVHFAGGVGAECWVMTPRNCAWRYGTTGTGMVWYPETHTLYRQDAPGDWSKVVNRVARDLSQRLKRKAA